MIRQQFGSVNSSSHSVIGKTDTEMMDIEKKDAELGPSSGADLIEPKIRGEEPQPPEKIDSIAPAELDWDSPDDPDNPKNWTLRKKIYHLACIGLYAFTWYVIHRPQTLIGKCSIN